LPVALSPAVKREEREADNLPPFTAEIKNGGATPQLLHTSQWNGSYLSTREILPLLLHALLMAQHGDEATGWAIRESGFDFLRHCVQSLSYC
jgi:hypothetical protein